MADGSFFEFLGRALEAIARECPAMHRRLHAELGKRRLHIRVDGKTAVLSVGEGTHSLGGAGPAEIDLRTTRQVLVELLDGRRTLLDAVVDDSFELRGAPEDVLALDRALRAFVHGAVRCPSMPKLLESYVASARRTEAWSRKPPLASGGRERGVR